MWAGTTGKLDDVPVEDIRRFESEFLDFLGRDHAGRARRRSATTTDLSDDTVGRAREARSTTFKRQFTTSAGELLVKDEPVAAAGRGRGRARDDHQQVKVRGLSRMGAQLRVYRRRIKSVQSTKKITKAMELIAVVADRQGAAAAGRRRCRTRASSSAAITAAASHAATVGKHPLTAPGRDCSSGPRSW